MMNQLVHDRDPYAQFRVEEYGERAKQDFLKGTLLRELVTKHLLNDGGNKLKFTMKGDEKFEEEKAKEEAARLYENLKALKAENIKALLADNEKLIKRLNEPEDLSILPASTLKDVPLVKSYPKPKMTTLDNGIPVWQFDTEMNGITCLVLKFNTSAIPDYLRPYIPLCAKYFL